MRRLALFNQVPETEHSPVSCYGSPLLSVDDAVVLATKDLVAVQDVEEVALEDCRGRVLARGCTAPAPIPSFANSAMDGYAIRKGDLTGEGPWTLPVIATVKAGPTTAGAYPASGAVRILTGAAVPVGFDTVLRQEDCVRIGDSVQINERPRIGLNVRAIGEYAGQGEVLLFGETELKPHHVGLLASIGLDRVSVRRKIRVGIASIGDELGTSQGELAHGSIFDSNRPLLKALANSPSSEIQDFGVFRDDEESLRRLFAAADGADLLVTSAGASVGEFDLVRSVLNGIGGTIDAWQVAMKPGKPVLFGHFGNTRFLGLPGNPMVAFVGYKLFGEPISQRLQGRFSKLPNATSAIAGFDSSRHPTRMEFVPVAIDSFDDQDRPVLRRVSRLGPGSLVPLAKADGLAVIRPGTEPLNVGQNLEWRRF